MPSAILLGSKAGAVSALTIMRARGWDIKCVVACPKFDYSWTGAPPLKEVSESFGIPVLMRQAEIDPRCSADFVISFMYRYLVNATTRGRATRAALNFHAAPLPGYGGWAFYNVAILEDASEYGCTCHYMDEGFDTGPILKVRTFPIDPKREVAYTLERKTQIEMQNLFLDFCVLAESGAPLPKRPQAPERMRYMSREQFEQLKEIPQDANAETIDRTARAFWYPPYPGAYVVVGGVRCEVYPATDRERLAQLLHMDDLAALTMKPAAKR